MSAKSFSHYEVVELLGAGGMGEVYRARDTRLGRDVAVKVLPEEFARDTERLARFEREAQLLASLNHPNIAAVYGLEESAGERYLILELVPGETLAERLARGPLALDETLEVVRQVAQALEAAHERGIIHRDLKPGNVKITPEGKVKVLDFGLAKDLTATASSGSPSRSPTLSALATREGVILGTAAYMSPEQARGKALDKRTDVWSFGCIVFEMLAGRAAFSGETTSDLIAAILKNEPDWKALPPTAPAAVLRLLRRCLEKDPARRLRDLADARLEIEEALAQPAATGPVALQAPSVMPAARPRRVWWGLTMVLVALAAATGIWVESLRRPPPQVWSGDFLGGSNVAMGPRISPEGKTLAFQALIDNLTQVAVMDPASGNWTVLTHDRSHGFVTELGWAPDGSKIYYARVKDQPQGIFSVPALGGEERLVVEDAGSPAPLPDGSLMVARVNPQRLNQLFRFWPQSGRFQAFNAYPESPLGSWVRVFPDGQEAVFFGFASEAEVAGTPHLYALNLASGQTRRLAPELKIERSSLAFPIAVTSDEVLTEMRSGDLHQIIAIPRRGTGPIRRLMALTEAPWYMDAAPDGTVYLDQTSRPLQILRYPLSGGTPEVLASTETYPADEFAPVEFPDGRVLLPVLVSGRARILVGRPGGDLAPLVDTPEELAPPVTMVGENQVALMMGSGAERTIALVSTSDGRVVRRLKGSAGITPSLLAAAPDGNTIYYVAVGNIWAIPSTDGTPRKVCAGDGLAVDPNGRELIVNLNEKSGTRLVRVSLADGALHDLSTGSAFRPSPLSLGGNSIDSSGRVVVGQLLPASWFFGVGYLDLKSARAVSIPLNYTGDIFYPTWGRNGRALATGELLRARLWRFRPVH